jgi:hypothetical protein
VVGHALIWGGGAVRMIIRGTTSDFTELRRPGLTTSNPPPNNSSAAQPTDCSGALTSVGYPHKGRRFTPAGFHHFVFTNARAEPMPARAATISTKRLSLLKQMQPNMRRVAMLWNRDDLGMSLRYGSSAKAAEVLGVGECISTIFVARRPDANASPR